MAIEIKELTIRLNIDTNSKFLKDSKSQTLSNEMKRNIVKECVEKVLEKLDNKFER